MREEVNIDQSAVVKEERVLGTVADLPYLIAEGRFKNFDRNQALICIVKTDQLEAVAESLRFFCADRVVVSFPAWDCEPFERLSPHHPIVHARVRALVTMAETKGQSLIIVTTALALIQKIIPKDFWSERSRSVQAGETLDRTHWTSYLADMGYHRVDTVRECGEFAVRGHLIDVFSPAHEKPVRIDFWDDQVETLSFFDPLMQNKLQDCEQFFCIPCHELILTEDQRQRFHHNVSLLSESALGLTAADRDAVARGLRPLGIERLMPLFCASMTSLLAQFSNSTLIAEESILTVLVRAIEDLDTLWATVVPPQHDCMRQLYLSQESLFELCHSHKQIILSRFGGIAHQFDQANDAVLSQDSSIITTEEEAVVPLKGPWQSGDASLWQSWRDECLRAGFHILWAYSSDTMRERAEKFLAYNNLVCVRFASWTEKPESPTPSILLVPMAVTSSRRWSNLAIIAEQDVFGHRIAQKRSSKKRLEAAFLELSQLNQGDYVVHTEHGVGRFESLVTVTVQNQPHDCVQLTYAGGDRLFVPVENVEVIARYGAQEASPELDRLGAASWQQRKAKVKAKIFQIADHLVKLAAARQLVSSTPVDGTEAFENFCQRFPYQETDDQLRAQEDIMADLASQHPMDRLICGDVGFGKTEVALRAAFLIAAAGGQVVVVTPTTLLCRQHYANFLKRFEGFPYRIAQLSRFVSAKEAAQTRAELADGKIQIVITTHAVFSKHTTFKDLRLLIIDEEHHFGVKQKEKLKEAWPSLHVLTLTATPIPRTLQMSMVGIRDMSLIATPPVDRQAVQISVIPFDTRVLREAILREKRRGGQVFLVSPRIEDLTDLANLVADHVPEVRAKVAHGQMVASVLDEVMLGFGERQFDVLISTSIVESGIDIPTANTIIIHRADLFGLAQLYQLRGRVGRAKAKGYAYLFLPQYQLKTSAIRRLEAMQSLDGLGAGFTLASHDMDIRGAGNLVGSEQSGYIREVGVELYQHMLEQAVAALREGGGADHLHQGQSPTITMNLPVSIPEGYIPDAGLRLGLYRRGAVLKTIQELNQFAEELKDRFGPPPDEVVNLLTILTLKIYCLQLGVGKLDVGDRGATLTFVRPPNLTHLVAFIQQKHGTVKLRPDEKLVVLQTWSSQEARSQYLQNLLLEMSEAKIAES